MQIKEIKKNTYLDMEQKLGSLEVFVEADKGKETEGKIFLWAQLLDEQGEETDRIFPMELEAQTQFCMEVVNPKLWNTDYPFLYELVLELRDEEQRLLGCTSQWVGFYHISVTEEFLLLNEKPIIWKMLQTYGKSYLAIKSLAQTMVSDGEIGDQEEEILFELRRAQYNCLSVPAHLYSNRFFWSCAEHGIVLLDADMDITGCQNVLRSGMDAENLDGIHPSFEIQVVEDGALIENRSFFVNTNVYGLCCEILSEHRILQQSVVEADIPAGKKRYLELPFIKLRNPGIYLYRVALCLKKDMPWGEKGEVIAAGESLISNLWLNEAE